MFILISGGAGVLATIIAFLVPVGILASKDPAPFWQVMLPFGLLMSLFGIGLNYLAYHLRLIWTDGNRGFWFTLNMITAKFNICDFSRPASFFGIPLIFWGPLIWAFVLIEGLINGF